MSPEKVFICKPLQFRISKAARVKQVFLFLFWCKQLFCVTLDPYLVPVVNTSFTDHLSTSWTSTVVFPAVCSLDFPPSGCEPVDGNPADGGGHSSGERALGRPAVRGHRALLRLRQNVRYGYFPVVCPWIACFLNRVVKRGWKVVISVLRFRKCLRGIRHLPPDAHHQRHDGVRSHYRECIWANYSCEDFYRVAVQKYLSFFYYLLFFKSTTWSRCWNVEVKLRDFWHQETFTVSHHSSAETYCRMLFLCIFSLLYL